MYSRGLVSVPDTRFEKNTGAKLHLQQFRAMFVKRVIHSWRNILVTSFQMILPIAFTLVACIAVESFPGPRDPPAMDLTLDHFDNPVSPYFVDNSTDSHARYLGDAYTKYLNPYEAPYINDLNQANSTEQYLMWISEEIFDDYVTKYMTAASFEDVSPNTAANYSTLTTSYFNNEAHHTPATSLSIIGNTLLQYFVSDAYTIQAVNHPLPRESSTAAEEEIETSNSLAWIVAYNVGFGMAFLVGSFILFVIRERITKAKHIQFVSGVNVINYWLSTFTWDFINYMIPSLLLLPLFAIFNLDAYVAGETIG